MGKTIIEKIFYEHLIDKNESVIPGSIVWINIDFKTARDFGGANVVNNLQTSFTGDLVTDKERTMFTFDCVAPAKTIPYAVNQHVCRQFARKEGLKVYDVDAGIGSHIIIDSYAKPGMTIVGTDSHFNIMGALNCFGQGMGDVDIAYIWKTGRTWFEVPPSVKLTVKGKRGKDISAKDIVLFMLRKFGSRKLLGKVVEIYGPEVISLMIPTKGLDIEGSVEADTDAVYESVYEIDLNDLKEPQISAPPSPHNVVDISSLKGKKVDTVFIGSCTNGRYSDFEQAAAIVKGRKIKTNGFIVPSTKEIYGKLLKNGIIETLFDAGFVIANPGCGGCASGQIGMTGDGEVIISTSNRNFKGKQGNGEVHLASPRIAAMSALKGEISGL